MNKRIKKTEFKIYDYDQNKDLIEQIVWRDPEEYKKYITNLAQEIGWIIIEFSSLEAKLDTALKLHLVEGSDNQEIIYSLISKKSFSEKTDLLNQLLLINFKKYTKIYRGYFNNFIRDLELIVKDLKEAGQIRNDFAHSNFSDVFNSPHC